VALALGRMPARGHRQCLAPQDAARGGPIGRVLALVSDMLRSTGKARVAGALPAARLGVAEDRTAWEVLRFPVSVAA